MLSADVRINGTTVAILQVLNIGYPDTEDPLSPRPSSQRLYRAAVATIDQNQTRGVSMGPIEFVANQDDPAGAVHILGEAIWALKEAGSKSS